MKQFNLSDSSDSPKSKQIPRNISIEIGKEGLFSVVVYEVLLGDISLEELNFRSEEEMLDFIKKWCFSLNS